MQAESFTPVSPVDPEMAVRADKAATSLSTDAGVPALLDRVQAMLPRKGRAAGIGSSVVMDRLKIVFLRIWTRRLHVGQRLAVITLSVLL